MELGSFFLAWSTVPMVLSMAAYLLVAVGIGNFRISARTTYWFFFVMVLISFFDLYYLFVTDQFQFSYIASYSSSDLLNTWPHFYKISALWAGQQGTFLLWLLFGVILGFWVKAKAKENEGWVMFFYILGQTFLLVLTLVSDPFEKLNFVPVDGQGLNPLLQNYWMQIHPPIVFVGFAAACIPFAFAMASLATNKYNDWVKQTMPWTIFTVVTLGLGIFIGGYWAYETLGWGGYWAWDPVENSSLIPWLVSIALVHGMVVEKVRGAWRRTNIFLAITMFLLIIYGTFLTRSGVLADFSVHSFADLGYNNILWGSIITMGAISYGLWGYRSLKMKVPSASGADILSQEFSTFLSMVLLLPFTLLVLFWTSFPLITTMLAQIPLLSRISPTPAAVDSMNYNIVGIVFSIIFCVILGLNALLGWKKTDPDALKKNIILPALISLAGSILFVILGFSKIAGFWASPHADGISVKVIIMVSLYFLFFLTVLFSLITNFTYLINRWKTGFRNTGGYITHVGFSLMLIGIIFSSTFGSGEKFSVSLGKSQSALGYDITFKGQERTTPKEMRYYFDLTKDNKTIHAYSDSKEMRRENEVHYVRTPFIHSYLFSDLYLSMENLMDPTPSSHEPHVLDIGETKNIFGTELTFMGFDSEEKAERLSKFQPQVFEIQKNGVVTIASKKVRFVGFEMGQHENGSGTQIGAVLSVEYKGKKDTITPYYVPLPNGGYNSPPIDFPGGGKLSLTQIKADNGMVSLSYLPGGKIPDIELGTVVMAVSGTDTVIVTPMFNAANPHSGDIDFDIPGGQLHLADINPKDGSARFVFHPSQRPILASLKISTKPMIILVWIGFIVIVLGAIVAFYRRMAEGRIKRRQ